MRLDLRQHRNPQPQLDCSEKTSATPLIWRICCGWDCVGWQLVGQLGSGATADSAIDSRMCLRPGGRRLERAWTDTA
jgi:hypothetical protein